MTAPVLIAAATGTGTLTPGGVALTCVSTAEIPAGHTVAMIIYQDSGYDPILPFAVSDAAGGSYTAMIVVQTLDSSPASQIFFRQASRPLPAGTAFNFGITTSANMEGFSFVMVVLDMPQYNDEGSGYTYYIEPAGTTIDNDPNTTVTQAGIAGTQNVVLGITCLSPPLGSVDQSSATPAGWTNLFSWAQDNNEGVQVDYKTTTSSSVTYNPVITSSEGGICIGTLAVWAGYSGTAPPFLAGLPPPNPGAPAVGELYCIPFVVGATYCSKGQILRPANPQESQTQSGPSQGKKRRMTEAMPLLYATQGMSMGVDFLKMRPLAFTSAGGTIPLTAEQLFSGVYKGQVDAESNYDNMWCWEVCRPYPCTLVSVECQLQTNENL